MLPTGRMATKAGFRTLRTPMIRKTRVLLKRRTEYLPKKPRKTPLR